MKTRVLLIVLLTSVFLSMPSFATSNQDHTCQGGHNCNQEGGGSGDVDIDVTANGGKGGSATATGGKGGSATATGGKGGSVTGSGNSQSKSKIVDSGNSHANGGSVYIGGGDGEGGGGRTLSPTSKSDATGGKSVVRDSGNSQQQQGMVTLSKPQQDTEITLVDDSDNSDHSSRTYIEEAQDRNPVNTAYAAPLIATEDTCMGSTSGGGQGITLGFSFATTWSDADCVIRKDARFLHNAHREMIAMALMCEKDSVKRAVDRAGTPEERVACGLDAADPKVSAAVVNEGGNDKTASVGGFMLTTAMLNGE